MDKTRGFLKYGLILKKGGTSFRRRHRCVDKMRIFYHTLTFESKLSHLEKGNNRPNQRTDQLFGIKRS